MILSLLSDDKLQTLKVLKETKLDMFKRTRQILFRLLQYGRKTSETGLKSAETKGRRLFQCWGVLKEKYQRTLKGWPMCLGHLCLLTGTYQSKGPTLQQSLGDRAPIFPDDQISKGPWEWYSSVVEDISQRGRKVFTIACFLK